MSVMTLRPAGKSFLAGAVALLLFLLAFLTGPALAERRVALVVGNSDYDNVSKLPNPTSDAEALADTLESIGFDDVTLATDLDYGELRRTLGAFSATAAGADIAVIYFAGHGIEVGGTNYLIPTDAELAHVDNVEFEAVPLATAMHALGRAGKLKLVVLDACRNNPFVPTMEKVGATRSVGRGLARVEPASSDTLVAYAARAGTVAEDGAGNHSPYAAALMKHLATPDLDVRLLFGRVRDEVRNATNGRQEPFIYGSLGGEEIALAGPGNTQDTERPPVSGGSTSDPAAAAWQAIKDTSDVGLLEAFIQRFGDSFFADIARVRLDELREQKLAAVDPNPAEQPGDGAGLAVTPRSIHIGTGGVTGVYYPAGGAVCRMVNANRDRSGLSCGAESTGGSISNLTEVRAGNLQFGIAQSDWHFHAYHGQSRFEDAGPSVDLRSVFSLYGEAVTIVARADSGIRTLDDLTGKRVNIGNPGSGNRHYWDLIAATRGWSNADFRFTAELTSRDAGTALCDGAIDALIYVVGHPSGFVDQVMRGCSARLIPVQGSDFDSAVAEAPYLRHVLIPGGYYPGAETSVETIGVGPTLVTSTAVPDDVVYEVVRSVFENLSDFSRMHPAFATLNEQSMIRDALTAPLHPGALRYYRERGWM